MVRVPRPRLTATSSVVRRPGINWRPAMIGCVWVNHRSARNQPFRSRAPKRLFWRSCLVPAFGGNDGFYQTGSEPPVPSVRLQPLASPVILPVQGCGSDTKKQARYHAIFPDFVGRGPSGFAPALKKFEFLLFWGTFAFATRGAVPARGRSRIDGTRQEARTY